MKLLLISCGGTIVSPSSQNAVKAGAQALENAAQNLIDVIMIPPFKRELEVRGHSLGDAGKTVQADVVSISPIDLLNVDSTEVGPDEWNRIIGCILQNYDDFDGFIVTHGTNSLAYTASALTFGLPRIGKPVVMTGSNIPLGVPFSDAMVNAANAVLLAHKLVAERRGGVVVVFASTIMPGVRTKKANGTDFEAFRTFNASNLGKMRPKEIEFSEAEYKKYVTSENPDSPWVGLGFVATGAELKADSHTDFRAIISSHTFHPGDDPMTYLAVMEKLEEKRRDTGQRGAFIIRAVGDGDVSHQIQNGVFKKARELQIPIVVTTQEPQGTSSFKGNEQSEGVEANFGVIPAWDMSIETMVVKLRYLLAKGLPYERVHQEFVKNYHGEIRKR